MPVSSKRAGSGLRPPFDDITVMAGAGTVALEMLEDAPDLDTWSSQSVAAA
jgi:threonine dehydratase